MTKYVYTMPPRLREQVISDEEQIIDLNVSSDFSIICGEDCDGSELDERLKFIDRHTDQMNLIAHVLHYLKDIRHTDHFELKCLRILDSILKGEIGENVRRYFEHPSCVYEQERILYYLCLKEETENRVDLFGSVLTELFPEGVNIYYNKLKKILYVLFAAEESERLTETYEVCKYLFADILINIKVQWNTFPFVIGKNNCIIVAENEQRCGTIV